MHRPLKILLGMVIGAAAGLFCQHFYPEAGAALLPYAQNIGQIFLRLIFMIVVPLIFSSLVLGIYELGDLKSLGRLGSKTLLYTLFASITSVIIGIALVSAFQPGKGIGDDVVAKLIGEKAGYTKAIEQANATKGVGDIVVSLIPKNPLASAVNALDGEMISLMVFALIFGMALVAVRAGEKGDALVKFLETVRDVSMQIVDYAMRLAPFGVAGLVFALTSRFGWGLLASIGKYVLVVLLGLLIQQLLVFGALLKFYAKRNPFQFLAQIREVILTAFSTASSNATLPTTIRVTEEELGVDRKIASFVLTIGSTANQNGTALFEGVTILFLAQVFHIDLSIGQQVVILLMSVLAGVGTAGVPGGSLPLIVIVLQTVGIPPEGIGIILGVDRLLDMSRTVLNVTGDIVAAVVIDHSEKGLVTAPTGLAMQPE